ncbi:MAG: helix-turn-helix transcriptional regulator [Armatimonadetes bacterium]|nr:helix-turn-helix transcriptional regulator [Armatimonadota bacterium]
MVNRSWSERVKHLRKTLNLSQEDFAHRIGVSFQTVNRRENRGTEPRSKPIRSVIETLEQELLDK